MTETFDKPPAGWFALDVMKKQERKWDWVALMVDVDPGDLKNCICDFPAKLYVPPDEYRPGERTARQCWVSVPGKHRNWKAAWGALHDMMAAGLH
jgi:hypothetical protein